MLIKGNKIQEARKLLSLALAEGPGQAHLEALQRILAVPIVSLHHVLDSDRSEEYQWIRENGTKHSGQWVALDRGRLLVSARTLRELQERLKATPTAGKPLLVRL